MTSQSKKYYQSIKELPMLNLINIYEESDLKYLLKKGSLDFRAYPIFENIQNEIIDNFGISKDFQNKLKLQIQLERMYNRLFVTQDKSFKLHIANIEEQLSKFDNKETKFDLFDAIVSMQKNGLHVDIKTVTVYEFYKYSQSLVKINAQKL